MVKAVTAAYCAREDGSVQRRWDSALWPRVCNDVRANERGRERGRFKAGQRVFKRCEERDGSQIGFGWAREGRHERDMYLRCCCPIESMDGSFHRIFDDIQKQTRRYTKRAAKSEAAGDRFSCLPWHRLCTRPPCWAATPTILVEFFSRRGKCVTRWRDGVA